MDISLGTENCIDILIMTALQNFSKRSPITVQVIKQLRIVALIAGKKLSHVADIFIE